MSVFEECVITLSHVINDVCVPSATLPDTVADLQHVHTVFRFSSCSYIYN